MEEKIMKKIVQLMLLMVLLISLTGCGGSNKPFIASGDGTQTAEETSKSASEQVTSFFGELTPMVTTVVKSLTEIGNVIFSVIPGVGVDPTEIETVRQKIKAKQAGGQ